MIWKQYKSRKTYLESSEYKIYSGLNMLTIWKLYVHRYNLTSSARLQIESKKIIFLVCNQIREESRKRATCILSNIFRQMVPMLSIRLKFIRTHDLSKYQACLMNLTLLVLKICYHWRLFKTTVEGYRKKLSIGFQNNFSEAYETAKRGLMMANI